MPKKRINKSPQEASGAADLQRIQQFLDLMEKNDLTELEWERGGEKIRLRCREDRASTPSRPTESVLPRAEISEPVKAAVAANQKKVLSPFVGTFYRAASPTSNPYVKEGKDVKRGDVLCIIEAMKLMNEIEAEFSGKILSVLVENGQPVEFGEPLFLLET